jgi:hypothetical protein
MDWALGEYGRRTETVILGVSLMTNYTFACEGVRFHFIFFLV